MNSITDASVKLFDTRCHLISGVEPFLESAFDVEMALVMAWREYTDGCRFIMATPSSNAYLRSGKEKIIAKYHLLREEVHRWLPGMELGLGCEVACTRVTVEEMIRHLDQGHILPMNGTKYVLASFPDDISRADLWYCLDKFHEAGYEAIIAHAQALNTLVDDIHEIQCLRGKAERGEHHQFRALIQVDLSALDIFAGNEKWVEKMIRNQVCDLLATNARNTSVYPAHIKNDMERMLKFCEDQIYLEAIAWENARKMFLS